MIDTHGATTSPPIPPAPTRTASPPPPPVAAVPPIPPRPVADPFPQALDERPVWSDADLAAFGLPVKVTEVVTVGGGIGSFVLADHLRIAGMPRSSLRALSNVSVPWETYEYLTRASQIPRHERLRSDSQSTPDNIWGFPSYAVREAVSERTLKPLANVLVEPILADYWTPRAGTAFAGMAREAQRIGFRECLVPGEVRMTRRRAEGGYFTVTTNPSGHREVWRSRFVHAAVGYPGLRYLPDLQDYRSRTNDVTHIVNAYEAHEHVYTALTHRPGTVLVRGGGIVASRILQRLMDDRERLGAQTTILHLFRTYVHGSHGTGPTWRRKGRNGFAFQGFNWPKSAWGGQIKQRLERLEGQERADLYDAMGGAHTPRRRSWERQKARAGRAGWYRTFEGTVERFDQRLGGGVDVTIKGANDALARAGVDYVIDCTGLDADISASRYLDDVIRMCGAGRNPLGRLDVDRTFEVRGTRSGNGRMYASGAATLGGYYAGVDSFLGLQYAALAIADDLARQGVVPRLGFGRSVRGWVRWVRNQPI